ncbi:hypothetical protein [Trinickia symbiotica]|uniref:hypothetical protein n=1 Tax=Trinickia symbiotica TaxID=863227 RepID=UPI0015E6D4F2|nr:hypothetical protein [Trinickia symbiotica]
MQTLGGSTEMQFLGNGDEAAKLAQFEHRYKNGIDRDSRYLGLESVAVQESLNRSEEHFLRATQT